MLFYEYSSPRATICRFSKTKSAVGGSALQARITFDILDDYFCFNYFWVEVPPNIGRQTLQIISNISGGPSGVAPCLSRLPTPKRRCVGGMVYCTTAVGRRGSCSNRGLNDKSSRLTNKFTCIRFTQNPCFEGTQQFAYPHSLRYAKLRTCIA